MRGTTPALGAMRRRRSGTAAFAVGLIAWAFVTLQPCCEAVAAAVPHDHPDGQHAPAHHHDGGGSPSAAASGGAHPHCVPHSLAAVDVAQPLFVLDGARSQDGGDPGADARPAESWPVRAIAQMGPPGLPPPGGWGTGTYLRLQRFLE